MRERRPSPITTGPDAFGEAWSQWLRYAWHRAEEYVPLHGITRLSSSTLGALYGSRPRPPKYREGTRPVLEGMLCALETTLPALRAHGQKGRLLAALSLSEWVYWEVYRRGQALRCGKWSQQLIAGGTEEEILGFLGRTGSLECSRLLVRFLQIRALPARLGFLFGEPYRARVGAEVYIDGAWRFLDVAANAHYLTRDGRIAGLNDLLGDPTCWTRVQGELDASLKAQRYPIRALGVAEYAMTPDPRGYGCKFRPATATGGSDRPVPAHALPLFRDRLKAHGQAAHNRGQLQPYTGWERLHGCAKLVNQHSANEPPMSEAVVICADTAPYLYSRFTPTRVEYRRGSRPVLEALLRDCVLRGRRRPSSDLDLAFAIYHWIFYQVLQRYLVLWDVWHARRMRYFGNEEDSASFRNRSDCYCTSRLLASMLQVAGIPARLIYMQDIDTPGGHTAAEAYIDGKWRFLDVSCHDYALGRDGQLASFWEIMSDPFCRQEGLRADPCKVTAILWLHYLANASMGNFPIEQTTAHYRMANGSRWFRAGSPDSERTARFGF